MADPGRMVSVADMAEKYFYLTNDGTYPCLCLATDEFVVVQFRREGEGGDRLGEVQKWFGYPDLESALQAIFEATASGEKGATIVRMCESREDAEERGEQLIAAKVGRRLMLGPASAGDIENDIRRFAAERTYAADS